MRGKVNALRLAAMLAAVSGWPGVAIAASSINGTITFEGKTPNLKPLAMDADPACAKKHTAPVPNEMLALGKRQVASRSYVAIYLHENRLYVLDATVTKGQPPPLIFQQSFAMLGPDGNTVRYQSLYYNRFP